MARLTRTAVLDRRTAEDSMYEGDFVTCCNCGRTMLVNIGTEKCPECGEETLSWEDKENQEVADTFFYNNDDYVLVDCE